MQRKLKILGILLLAIAFLMVHNGLINAEWEERPSGARLAAIWVNGEPLQGFSPMIQEYTILLPSASEAVPIVEAKAVGKSAVVSIEPATVLPGGTIIRVAARDGTKTTYIIMFTVPETAEKSKDATLCEIRIDGQLLEDFSPLKTDYEIKLKSKETTVPEVTAIANDPMAMVEIDSSFELPGKATVTVYAEDGTKRVYTVKFSVAAARAEEGKKEVIKYNFNDIHVVYAAEFMAVPNEVDENGWMSRIAGGTDNFVKVTFGVVAMDKDVGQWKEEFIKVEGAEGSERFLVNSGSYEYYEGTNKVKSIKSQYWSAKQIEDNSIVKDFNGPIKAAIMWREFDEDQNLTSVRITCYNDFNKGQSFYDITKPDSDYYAGDLETLTYDGSPIIFYN